MNTLKKLTLIVACMCSLIACQSSNTENTSNKQTTETSSATETSSFESLKAGDFQLKMIELKHYTILDVRTAEEFKTGNIPQAKNIDVNSSDFEQKVSELEKDKPIFVYCKGGVRSKKAAEKLQEMGFKRIIDLDGGIDAWKKANFEVSQSL